MATVGHTLVGLSLAGCSRAESRGGALRFVWPGLMVLLAHLLDVVEWGVILISPAYFDHKCVSNSVWLTTIVAGVACVGLAVFARLRKPWPYMLAVAAILSHAAMDHGLFREVLVDAYGYAQDDDLPGLGQSMAAEVWLCGLLLVGVLLIRASSERGCPRRGRAAAGVLAAAAILAAVARSPWLWVPAYGLAVVHALLLQRKHFNWRLAWSVVPLIPLLALLSVELWAGWLFHQGDVERGRREYAAAVEMFNRSAAVPTRSSKTAAYVRMSYCWRSLGDFRAAEKALLRAEAIREGGWVARYQLAMFYIDRRVSGTSFDRPELAAEMLQQIVDGDVPDHIKGYARRRLASLRAEGRIE